MLTKDEELGCLEILKSHFPELRGRGLVIGLYEFLQPDVDLPSHICHDRTPKEAALAYIQAQKPYIVLDESEGYKCIFLRGRHIKAQYDVTNGRMLGYVEGSFGPVEAARAADSRAGAPNTEYTPLVAGSLNFLRAQTVSGTVSYVQTRPNGTKAEEMTVRISSAPLHWKIDTYLAWSGCNIVATVPCEGEVYGHDGQLVGTITELTVGAMLPFGAKGNNPDVGWLLSFGGKSAAGGDFFSSSLLGSFLDFKGSHLSRTDDIISKDKKWNVQLDFAPYPEQPASYLSHWNIQHYLPKDLSQWPNPQVWRDNCVNVTYQRSIRGEDLVPQTGWTDRNPMIVSNNPEQFGSNSIKNSNEGGFKHDIGKNSGLLFHASRLETYRSVSGAAYTLDRAVELYLFHFCRATYKGAASAARIYILVEPEQFPATGQLDFRIKGHHETGGFVPQQLSYIVAKKWLEGSLPEQTVTLKKSEACPVHILARLDVPYEKFIEGRYQITPPAGTSYGVYIYASTEPNETAESIYQGILKEKRTERPDRLPVIDGVYASTPSVNGESFGPPEAGHWGRNAGLYSTSLWQGELEVKVPYFGHSIGVSLNHHGAKPGDADHVVRNPLWHYVDSKEPSFENYGACFKAKIRLVNEHAYPKYVSPVFMAFDVDAPSSHYYNGPVKVNNQLIPILLKPEEKWIYLASKMKFDAAISNQPNWSFIKLEPGQEKFFEIEFYVPGLASCNHGILFETVYTEEYKIGAAPLSHEGLGVAGGEITLPVAE